MKVVVLSIYGGWWCLVVIGGWCCCLVVVVGGGVALHFGWVFDLHFFLKFWTNKKTQAWGEERVQLLWRRTRSWKSVGKKKKWFYLFFSLWIKRCFTTHMGVWPSNECPCQTYLLDTDIHMILVEKCSIQNIFVEFLTILT